jgi:hypothetical protein
MALSFAPAEPDTLSLREFIEWCDSASSLRDPENAQEIANAISAAAANRRLIPDFLVGELRSLRDFQHDNTYKPPTFVVHKGKGYTLRAVVWLPLEERLEPSLFSYHEAHDHNFDFYTCGCFGPGYTTDIYEYDPDSVVGLPGERVKLHFLERTTLPEGKVMFYRASHDVHVQLPPPSLSVSFNLILAAAGKPRRQFDFDLTTERIKAQVDAANWHQALFEAASLAGDERTLEVLVSIAETHPSSTVRALGWKTLIERQPSRADHFFAAAVRDDDVYVKRTVIEARQRSEGLHRERSAVVL